ncbi:hypothetical protein JTE90_021072 [Oedothorax gibbosus]|uniref:Uncharacterized protein n=1 Tax=Oedothorax gibbosus TaxID=931172 RepID=A0AAV6VRD6_9ARAC|nr:hypothetical protein JTE90_021072 [Oedothorax gibbosus]
MGPCDNARPCFAAWFAEWRAHLSRYRSLWVKPDSTQKLYAVPKHRTETQTVSSLRFRYATYGLTPPSKAPRRRELKEESHLTPHMDRFMIVMTSICEHSPPNPSITLFEATDTAGKLQCSDAVPNHIFSLTLYTTYPHQTLYSQKDRKGNN